MIKEAVEIHIVHQCYPDHCGQPRKAPRAYEPPPHYHEQQVGDQRYPNLYLDGIGTLSIEVFEWKVLLYLLKQQFYGPSLVVDNHDFERVRGHVVGQEGDEFALLNIDISDDARVMDNSGTALEFLSEGNPLYTNRHHPFRRLTHDVLLYRVLQVLLHLRDIDDAALRHLLKLRIVDVGTIPGNDIPPVQRGRQEHKRVIGGCGSEADVRWNSLVGLDYTVHFDTPFLFTCFGMSAHAFEEQVGEEGNRCEVDYLQPFHPFRFIFSCAQPAVRRKKMTMLGV